MRKSSNIYSIQKVEFRIITKYISNMWRRPATLIKLIFEDDFDELEEANTIRQNNSLPPLLPMAVYNRGKICNNKK